MAVEPVKAVHAPEGDLAVLVGLLWRGRWFVLVATVLCAIGGAAYAWFAREWFQAEVVLIQSDSKSAPSSLAQLGGLASLAGINIGGSGASQAPLAVLRSREIVRRFIQEQNLLHTVLFDQWDAQAGKWKQPVVAKQPDIRDAVRRFDRSIRSVSEDKKTGLVRLSITWTDAATAATWANLFVARVNAVLRDQAIGEAEENIKYLQKEMASTSVAPLQQSIGRVLESEMQKLMLARGAEQFAFKVIDPATPSKIRVRPKRVLIVGCFTIAGLFLSVLILLARSGLAGITGREAQP